MKNYDLGTEKIGRLVRHFSVPCVISMLVAALYNIVDQIFIGWSPAGAFGNAATNIVYPFTVLALGLSLLVGDGAAANFSLESGRKNKDRSDKSVGNGFLLLIILSILLCLMGFIFKSQILNLFGANMKVFGIVVSIVIGISLGGQPIIGFNMGAGNVERVNETIRTITKIVLAIGTVFFLIFELAPDFVISLFGKNNSPEYTEYARLCVRIFLSGIILTCFIKSAAIMLQSLGKSGKSTLLALLRDVIIFVPSSIIMALISHNIVTMLWASLISDVISFIFAVAFIMAETRKITQ